MVGGQREAASFFKERDGLRWLEREREWRYGIHTGSAASLTSVVLITDMV